MKTVEEIKARYWFLKGNKAALQYARNCDYNSFAEEIKEDEIQISVLKWVLNEEQE